MSEMFYIGKASDPVVTVCGAPLEVIPTSDVDTAPRKDIAVLSRQRRISIGLRFPGDNHG